MLDMLLCFFCQAEGGIRYLVRSRGLGDVYKRQEQFLIKASELARKASGSASRSLFPKLSLWGELSSCLLYTSDAADERSSVDIDGRRIIKKKTHK